MRRLLLSAAAFLLLGTLYASGSAHGKVKFAFLTDIHLSPNTASERNLLQIVAEINAAQYDFTIVTGDLTNTGSDAELNAVKAALDGLVKPVHVISGNHETNWSESACMTFNRLWGDDKFVFEYGGYAFVGLSTGPYMKMGNGHVREEDVYWLDGQLKSLTASGKPIIFAAHYPMNDDLDNWFKITTLLKRYGVKADLCGHEHRISLHNFDGIIGLMGRPTVNNGYNIITLENDSLYFAQKKTGTPEISLFARFSLNNNDIIKNLPVTPRPDYSINSQYQVEITEITDSASIYTGIATIGNSIFYANSRGELIAGDAQNSKKWKLLWKRQIAGPVYSTPVALKNTVITGTVDGKLQGFNAKTGTLKWSLKYTAPIIADGACDGKYLYAGIGSSMCKIDVKTGQQLWKSDVASGYLQGKPAIGTNCIVFGAWDGHLYCIDKNTGKLLWKWDNGKSSQVLFSPANVVPALSDDKVFIVAPDRYMTALDIITGKTLWRTNQYTVRESMGMSADGTTIYAKTMQDTVIAVPVTPDVFRTDWKIDAGFGYEHNPCPIVEHAGIIYAGGKDGLLVAINRDTHSIKWKHKCGNSAINKITPDAKNGGVWVTLIEGKVLHIK
ncbi:MAG: PQQ-binding-like beta-propeller repeat protein [Bacteroidales bacterium]|jgi:outer membrane protein assembly factor BamB/predicted MPP superfamily phosphohydrolase|nr:PQQ-binding-like beta-propeller repeat protein [Bacteroidales bacterium]